MSNGRHGYVLGDRVVDHGDTAATDRGEKRDEYARLPGIQRYVLLEQGRKAALVLEMTQAGWQESEVTEGNLDLPELGVALPLDAVYRGVRPSSELS